MDVSGSMQGTIDSVEENIQAFSEYLAGKGLDLNISVIEYNSDMWDTQIYGIDKLASELNFSSQIKDVTLMKQIWETMYATGGGKEIPIDALGFLIGNDTIHWRSSAHKFAFLMTDENDNDDSDNRWGYTTMQEVADKLNEEGVMTSVVTEMSNSFESTYGVLWKTTGGKRFDIYADNFAEQMKEMADEIIGNASNEYELHLSEPRLLVNMSVCYYADDEESTSDDYYNLVSDRMKDYSKYIAQATDGHVIIRKAYVFNTDNRSNFYINCDDDGNPDYSSVSLPAIADIRIITKINDDGTFAFNAKIVSNAHPAGFYNDQPVETNSDNYKHFKNLDQLLGGKKEFQRITMSGHLGGGWSYTLEDSQYSETLTHETGHYLMTFRDEYQDKDSSDWNKYSRPYANYGLMDAEHEDIELSKDSIDYSYANGDYTSKKNATEHSFDRGMSCESTLAYLLENGAYPWSKASLQKYYDENSSEFSEEETDEWENWLDEDWNITSISLFDIENTNENGDKYKINYTKTETDYDRTAEYSYAECTVVDWTDGISQKTNDDIHLASLQSEIVTANTATEQEIADISTVSINETNVVFEIDQKIGEDLQLFTRTANGENDSEIEEVKIKNNQITLPLISGNTCELIVIANVEGEVLSNTHIVERSPKSENGYYYQSNDLSVEGYVIPESENEYLFMTVSNSFEYNNYVSVNKALTISTSSDKVDQGELYSVASVNSDIDYTTISWFKYDGTTWTQLDTDLSTEENMNIGARCDYAGEGTYVLMAKAASDEKLSAVTNLEYTNPTDRDGIVRLTFDDPNEDTVYYNVYYSEEKFSSIDDDGVYMQKDYAGSDYYAINLGERDIDAYAAVIAVNSAGATSALSEVIAVNTGEADRDGDGIPDWYCDEYLLWPPTGEEKDIANSDDDGDGLTNLEEYKGGSDPTDSNDPVRTSNVAVTSVGVNKSVARIKAEKTVTLTATINPNDATNQNVQWYVDDESIATISADGLKCIVTGVAAGSTKVTVVTLDGGYTATTDITVSKASETSSSSASFGSSSSGTSGSPNVFIATQDEDSGSRFTDVKTGDWFCNAVNSLYDRNIVNGTTATTFSPDDETTRGMVITMLYRMNGEEINAYNVFDDVDAQDWYGAAVAWGAENKIVSGVGDGLFEPNRSITREELVKMLYGYVQYASGAQSVSGSLNAFADFYNVSGWATDAMRWAIGAGIVSGYSEDDTLRPKATATRAELAQIIYNYIGE